MQQQTQPTVNQQLGQTLAPPKKATNKKVSAVPVMNDGKGSGFHPDENKASGGLMGVQEVKSDYQPTEYQSVTGAASTPSPSSNTPQTTFNGKDYQSDGYTGLQGNTEYNYDPRDEALVQNQITGLLDPESDLMRRAIANANSYSAGRGLQSSSIATGAATSAMIDKALPIAQQDAATYANADQTGWQQSFTADQNNLARKHDASMFDKEGKLRTDLQNDQLSFTGEQNDADRALKTELQNLQYQQNLGMLDAQGAQRMQELNAQQGFAAQMQDLTYKQNMGTMDKQAELQEKRDQLMSSFDLEKMDKAYLQDLEKTKVSWEHDDAVFTRNLDGQISLEYKNTTADAYNKYLEQVSAIYSNPNMTPSQQSAGVRKLEEMFTSQRQQMQIIYGVQQDMLPPVSNSPSPYSTPTYEDEVPEPLDGLPEYKRYGKRI